jgi:hypothetical protein
VKRWGPQYLHATTGRPAIDPRLSRIVTRSPIFARGEISVSGLQISRDASSILVSYQGDQVYVFDTFGEPAARSSYASLNLDGQSQLPTQDESSDDDDNLNSDGNDDSESNASYHGDDDKVRSSPRSKQERKRHHHVGVGARSCYGGHFNYATFLKTVSFFGPKDEYIVSGSDSGHMWIWDAKSGNLDVEEPQDRTCRVANFLKAGKYF